MFTDIENLTFTLFLVTQYIYGCTVDFSVSYRDLHKVSRSYHVPYSLLYISIYYHYGYDNMGRYLYRL